MVTCHKCGTRNEADAKYCAECGVTLEGTRRKSWEESIEEWGENFGKRAERWGEQFGKRMEDECFGLPNGSIAAGLILGIIIVLAGISWITGFEFFWPVLIIVFGVVIIAGSVYGFSRR